MHKFKLNIISNNLLAEANHLCFVAKSIQMGFFKKGGFLVLPYPLPQNGLSVYFPNLKLTPLFWQETTNSPNLDLGRDFPTTAVNEVASKLKTIVPNHNLSSDIQPKWSLIEADFLKTCHSFLDLSQTLKEIGQINVLVTPYGTRGAFDTVKCGNKINLYLTFREDFDITELGRTLLLAFYLLQTRTRTEIGEPGWTERQATIDYLCQQTKFRPTTTSRIKREFTKKEITDSRRYLNCLGFPDVVELTLLNDQIVLNGKVTNIRLTLQEQKVLDYLINHPNRTVSFDKIANIIWEGKALDKYSLFAIAKVIENIRKKVRQMGFNRQLIHTLRGQGYTFTN